MAKQDALMESLSLNLHGFLNQVHRQLSVPEKKSLWDGFIALIRAGSPIVCQMAQEVPTTLLLLGLGVPVLSRLTRKR